MASLLLSPGSWCTQGFVCALQEAVSPVLWTFCIQIPLAFKVKFPGGSQSLCQIPKLGNLLGPRTFARVQEFLWYNCFPVCGSSAQQLYGGANGNLLQEDLGHMLLLPGLLQPEPLSPRRPLLIHTLQETHTLKGRSGSVSYAAPGSWCTQGFCLCPLSVSAKYEV